MSNKPLDVVYLAGTNYSGSTLLAFICNSHPDMVSIGEMGPVPRWERPAYLCSCGEPVYQCPFYLAIADHMGRAGVPFRTDRMQLRHTLSAAPRINSLLMGPLGSVNLSAWRDAVVSRTPWAQDRVKTTLRRTEAFIAGALAASGARVFFDAHKSPHRIALLAQSARIRLRVVHLVRDPRAQCWSSARRRETSLDRAAWSWRQTHRTIERHLEATDVPMMRLTYEDFCRQPSAAFGQLCTFAGVPARDIPENFRDTDHHILGNAMRKPRDGRTTIQLDERWRDHLSHRDLRAIGRWTDALARRYGCHG